MGTPDFSVPALQALAARPDFQIPLVVTQPDRPRGRGKKIFPPPVKIAAQKLGLAVIQPETVNVPEIKELLASHAPDYFVVSAFGQILSQELLDIPQKYPVNIHASLLPKYRGASPIQAAVANMDTKTGVTTMIMEKTMDTGDILLARSIDLLPEHTAELETIDQINANTLTPVPQDDSLATYVPLLKKEHGNIDWTKPARNIIAHIHAMTPWPGAFTFLGDQRMKIFNAVPGEKTNTSPGDIFALSQKGIHVGTGQDSVIITELMGRSGKRLSADAFLRGHAIDLPARFHNGKAS